MPRNIVVCCDGTANEFERDKTNVLKLYSVLAHNGAQATYYHPGLGTMEAAGALSSVGRKATKLMGKAIGYGLQADIRDTYVFLMRHHEPGDRLYLFGFSRGAFTVRAIAAMLHMYGLIRKENEALVPYAVRMLTTIDKAQGARDPKPAFAEALKLAREFRKTFASVPCKPYFVGLWDCVSSVGWIENPLKIPYSSNNPSIEIGRHAVSIDERRAFFRTNLWRPASSGPSGPKDLQQVWFPGVHSDVGGGYPEAESGLSKIALRWMCIEATQKGLEINKDRFEEILGEGSSNYAPPDPAAMMHVSLQGGWRLAEYIPKRHWSWQHGEWRRRMNRSRARTIPGGALIHDSAYQRGDAYAAKLPADALRVSDHPDA